MPQVTTHTHAPRRFHSLVWLLWLGAGIAAISTNPLLNLLVMAQAVLVALTCHSDSPVGHAFGLFVRLGAILVLVRTVLAAIPVGGFSYGATPLFAVPQLRLPIWLGGLDIGGAATLEMLVGGFVAGMRLWALILVFGAFNAVADHYGLLRRTPRVLFHAGLATTIALTFVPQVILQLGAIRDAQRVRGHRFRSLRDMLPLVVPLLAGGLERSIQLAEAMDSRGYGHTMQPRGHGYRALLAVGGLSVLALGLFVGFSGSWQGWLVAAIGAALAVGAVQSLNAGARRTRYLREQWHRRDTLVVLASLALIGGMAALRALRLGGLLYTTLPRVSPPAFEPMTGALVLLLCVPALVQIVQFERTHEPQQSPRRSQVADRT